MNIDNTPGKRREKGWGQNAHKSGQGHPLHPGLTQGADQFLVKGFSLWKIPVRDTGRGNAHAARPLQPIGIWFIGDNQTDIRV